VTPLVGTRSVLLPGGEFAMGSSAFYSDEAPVHRVRVDAFEIERYPVTNAEFADFVAATGYRTVAERPLDPAEYPGLPQSDLAPGSLVFTPTPGPVDLRDFSQWWRWVPGANWCRPAGRGSTVRGKDDHPVVQVCFEDAAAYARWAGKDLPTEAEWEYAARAGLDRATYAWGDELRPDGTLMANTWQGHFPYDNHGADGWIGTSPVGSFPPNGFDLYDMIGNVWEWTTDYYHPRRDAVTDSCCAPKNPRAADPAGSAEPGSDIPRRVLKGGSHLCAPEYCLRYRPAARSPQAQDSATSHIGFRCVRRDRTTS
jgi:formylglycine-generating enzyme required for sulfatase activity